MYIHHPIHHVFKQHSVFDVLTGIAMAASLYWLVYYLPETKAGSTLVENLEFLKG